MTNRSLILLLSAGLAGLSLVAPGHASRVTTPPRAERPVRVSINDNRAAAGTMRGNVLGIRLVARPGMWYPDGDDAPGTLVPAFAEEGRAPHIPGPMIRVRAGTEVSVTLRNALPTALTVHGLTSRGTAPAAARDSVHLAAGAMRTLRIRLDAPGTYYYWGTTMGRTVDERVREDAQLTGAIIVDPATGPRPADRVIVMGMWSDTSGRWLLVRKRMLTVMNGRSWPHTERLAYTLGDSIRWRVINASADVHPMHLHGFYFRVDSRGDGVRDSVYAGDARDMVVTDLMRAGHTMSMTWSPERPGNWLFHCHLPIHFAPRGSLGMPPAPASPGAHGAHAMTNHALQGMNGLVLGVTVRPARGRAAPASREDGARRQLRLVIRANPNGTPAEPHFEFALDGAAGASAATAASRPGSPPLILTRHEPVAITVVNTLAEPSAIHWHGIELESYYDGVAGYSGAGRRISPVIAPGDSFVARFAPPRAGTFIYHTHIDEERQQPAGLAGPIIVLDSASRHDPARDIVIMATSPRTAPPASGRVPRIAWLNGSAVPAPLKLHVGVRYRLRFINMTARIPLLRFDLSEGGTLAPWRLVAKDGADLPAGRQVMRPGRHPVSIGETLDVEFTPERAGDHRITAHMADGTVVGTLPLHVSAADPGKP